MKRGRIAALLFLVLATPLGSSAQQRPQPLPKGMPPYGPPVPFRAPHVEVKKLGNGLTLWLVPRPGFPKVAFAFAVRGGMAADAKDRPGLSQLLVATLDQGRPAAQSRLPRKSRPPAATFRATRGLTP